MHGVCTQLLKGVKVEQEPKTFGATLKARIKSDVDLKLVKDAVDKAVRPEPEGHLNIPVAAFQSSI